jgi:hypothetical protein
MPNRNLVGRFASRILWSVVVLTAVAPPGAAQLVGLRVVGDAVKKYKGQLFPRGADFYLVGDAVEGLDVNVATGKVDVTGAKFVVICAPDVLKPDAPLYEGRDNSGALKSVSARKLVVQRTEFNQTTLWDKVQTLTGLRDEYLRKKEEIEGRRKQLAALKMGTPEWFELQRRLLIDVDALVGWLRSTLFAPAADGWEKQYGAELKRAGAAASKSRLEESKKIVDAEKPSGLETVAPGLKWHGRQSKHVRMYAPGDVPAPRLDAALLVGERIIESFRTDFIDPELEADDRDPVPDELFVEFCVAPKDDQLAVAIWEKHYGERIGEPREKTIKMSHRGRGGVGFLHLAKGDEGGIDLDGYVAHSLGHDIANLAFNGRADMPAWIGEGFAYWISFEHLSRNSVTCFAFSMPTYARAAEKEGEKAVEQGLRAAFNALALAKGPSMSDLVQTPLVSMESAHLAKSWSVIDWLVTKEPKRLRRFIRAACVAQNGDRTDLEKFRPKAMEIFEQHDGNVYAAIDEAWKKYAAASGGEAKPKKKGP